MRKEKVKKEVVEKIEEEKKDKKKMFEDVKNAIINKIMLNCSIGVLILAYWLLIILCKMYVDKSIVIIACNVANIVLLALTIVMFEIAYKKNNGVLAIYGIEIMVLTIFTLFIPYIYYESDGNTRIYLSLVGIVMAIYYSIKSACIYILERKKYIKSQSDIKEIITKERKNKKKAQEESSLKDYKKHVNNVLENEDKLMKQLSKQLEEDKENVKKEKRVKKDKKDKDKEKDKDKKKEKKEKVKKTLETQKNKIELVNDVIRKSKTKVVSEVPKEKLEKKETESNEKEPEKKEKPKAKTAPKRAKEKPVKAKPNKKAGSTGKRYK